MARLIEFFHTIFDHFTPNQPLGFNPRDWFGGVRYPAYVLVRRQFPLKFSRKAGSDVSPDYRSNNEMV